MVSPRAGQQSNPLLRFKGFISSWVIRRIAIGPSRALGHRIVEKEILAFNLSVTNIAEYPSRLTHLQQAVSYCRAPKGTVAIWTMTISQDGIPVPGPCILRCPCSAATVSWKLSTCFKSRTGVLRQVTIAIRMCGRRDNVSTCCMEIQLVWCKTYRCCRRLCFGVVGD